MNGLEMIEFAKRKLCLEAVYMETKDGFKDFLLGNLRAHVLHNVAFSLETS